MPLKRVKHELGQCPTCFAFFDTQNGLENYTCALGHHKTHYILVESDELTIVEFVPANEDEDQEAW